MEQGKAQVSTIAKVRKRNGDVVTFDQDKISNAVARAQEAVDGIDPKTAAEITTEVLKKLAEHGFGDATIPSVEDIQDTVEETLLACGSHATARKYILYRQERKRVRNDKMRVLNVKTLDPIAKSMDLSSLKVLAARYLNRDNKNELVETPQQLFERIGVLIGLSDMLHSHDVYSREPGDPEDPSETESYLNKLDAFDNKFMIGEYYINKWHFRSMIRLFARFQRGGHTKVSFKELLAMIAAKRMTKYGDRVTAYIRMMTSGVFLPNSPTIMNAGGELGQLSACFVLDMQDHMEDIMKTASHTATIFKSGGGVGINYSGLREEGSIVASTSGVASGPVSFMNIINTVTEVVKQGGRRRGANMGIMEVWHPDIEQFIEKKTEPGELENFNVSVGVWEDFWRAVTGDELYTLKSPVGEKPVKEVSAEAIINMIAQSAWRSAEPGIIFFDNINRRNPFAKARGGPIRTTNPCGEQGLYPYESCNLGSINLAALAKRQVNGNYEFDWAKYEQIIRTATRFLDNVIDMNIYPIDRIEKASVESRRIGLGVMGVADLLYMLRIPYNSEEGYELQARLAEALTYYSMDESIALSRERGSFPLYGSTEYPDGELPFEGYYHDKESHTCEWDPLVSSMKKHGIRNVLTTTVAPTGTLSMLADCSNGMEPVFGLTFLKKVTVGEFFYANKAFEEYARENGFYSEELLKDINDNYASLRGLERIDKQAQDIFVTAMDIHWADHLMAQAVWQRWIGNAIAKTINMPHDASVDDVKAAYLLAHEMGLKGVTVYRDGSRHKQVLHMADSEARKRFSTHPSAYVCAFVRNNIDTGRVKKEVVEALRIENQDPRPSPEAPKGDKPAIVQEGTKCPVCGELMVFSEGCSTCIECGHSNCSVG